MDLQPIDSVADAIRAASVAYDGLADLAEDIEDEWSYVTDLADAWRERLDEVVATRGDEPAGIGVAEAVAALSGEVAAIDDPHRAIDWLSTFPQVLLAAIGERP
ncbi:MAG TPA: hypothetical protein VFY18_09040 [Candidatus Limnocylindrales bacterium]|nr:hypothetical protein [Candidatus Limnocylindrales bacterium]